MARITPHTIVAWCGAILIALFTFSVLFLFVGILIESLVSHFS